MMHTLGSCRKGKTVGAGAGAGAGAGVEHHGGHAGAKCCSQASLGIQKTLRMARMCSIIKCPWSQICLSPVFLWQSMRGKVHITLFES